MEVDYLQLCPRQLSSAGIALLNKLSDAHARFFPYRIIIIVLTAIVVLLRERPWNDGYPLGLPSERILFENATHFDFLAADHLTVKEAKFTHVRADIATL